MKDFFKDRAHRAAVSITAGMLAAILAVGSTGEGKAYEPMVAWWGALYPKFCFMEVKENEEALSDIDKTDSGGDSLRPRLKISFWVAKALNW